MAPAGLGPSPQYFEDVRADIRGMTSSSFIHMTTQSQRFRLPAGLERVRTPTLVIAGRHEYRVMRRSAREVAAMLPHAEGRFVAMDNRLAHEHSWNLWAPELFNATVRARIENRSLPIQLLPMT